MHMFCWDKKAMHERHRHAESVLKRGRTRRRDEKYAGRAGPPDCACDSVAGLAGLAAGGGAEATVPRESEEESAGGWDMVSWEEHVHSPGPCPPPCISRTPARCSVS